MRRSRTRLAGVLAAALLTSAVLPGCAASNPTPVTVMTRNLYLGGDITRPVRAATGLTGRPALLALGHANHELRFIVDVTDFATRSRLLAAEIAGARPDLIGLQEVALWRHGPLQLDRLGQVDATEVDQDFLATLLADLAARQTSYEVVRVQPESDVEAPAFTGDPLAGTGGSAQDVRLTIRDVILVRADAGVRIDQTGSGQYAHRLDVQLGGIGFSFVRGYAWADVSVGAARLRFITTHLESQSADLALAQAQELRSGPAASTPQPIVLVGDANSDPADTAVRPGERVASAAAYALLTAGGGFADQWLRAPDRTEPGFTAVLGERVDDPTAAGLDRRLDLVLARGTGSDPVLAARTGVVGDEPSDRDPATGRWPSDHAGVVVELRIG